MPTNSRIFWTTEEKNTVLDAAHKLRAHDPRVTLKLIGTKAQAALPKPRRRPVNNKLTTWLSTALKGGTPVTTRGSRAKGAKGAKPVTATAPRSASRQRAKPTSTAAPGIVQTLIEYGATILSGILAHPRVRAALESQRRSATPKRRGV
jgi:hypothetical protein